MGTYIGYVVHKQPEFLKSQDIRDLDSLLALPSTGLRIPSHNAKPKLPQVLFQWHLHQSTLQNNFQYSH
jgi:hypothetical protein